MIEARQSGGDANGPLIYIYLLKKWIAITSVVEGVLLRKVWCVRLFLSPPLSVSFAFCSPRMLTRALHNSALLAPYTAVHAVQPVRGRVQSLALQLEYGLTTHGYVIFADLLEENAYM